ncbi:ABC transporter ATP-binding protein, partial [Methylobacterium platani]|uniref:ABC transporter ATP-binding protein n=2 Tax=Methylobacterium platani TaxID=427683 RepID=UPI000653E9F4
MAAQPNLRGANVPLVPPAPAAPLLRIAQVEKVYGGRQGPVRAVASASLEIGRGEFVSLLGPSGCGKSTLLMMIAGLETPTSGMIELDGSRVVRPRRDIGIIFQDATLLPWKSTLENVLFPIRILKLPLAPYRERARELLAMVGLGGFENHKPSQLSGGMRQRVAICRALIHDPAILLMDEPFSALDAITRDQMNEALSEIMDKTAKTVIFVTHSIREAAFLSDRVVVMGGRPSHVVLD